MPQPLRFAHFEVLMRSDGSPHLLGQGAMGATYKALDQNLLSLAVIKVPSPELLSNPTARQRFLQEAQMMARLRHPHVANVFYYGDTDSGPFYAMEFCDGPSLHDYVDEHGPLDVTDTFRIALQIASALQALDSHELIHRDLKPSNIILTADTAGAAHAKLIDFGVAREGTPADAGGLTLGGFIGTPAFASPEQLLEAPHLDSRSDLYSLGAVMWFCLTGAPPFTGSLFEIMAHHVNTEPDWTLLPEMTEPHLSVLKRLLAKSAEERYSSPASLVQTLQDLLGIATTRGNRLHIRQIAPDTKSSLGGYEPLEAIGADDFGRVWIARDALTRNIVTLREFPPEFAQKQGIILRIQRLIAFLRNVEHPRWLKVLHFEQTGSECRLATERIAGPTALQLLKVHHQLNLKQALPLLLQVAEAMDAGSSEGLPAMETALERLSISVPGWEDLDENSRGSLLRQPMESWSDWSVKVCPLRLSNSPQDYALPSDSLAAQAITRISSDFVQLCHRLLTGQVRTPSGGGGSNNYVPSPALTAEGNDFFERHFTATQRSQSPQTCHTLLRRLCIAEGVPPPDLVESPADEDPFATRIVTRRAAIISTLTAKTGTPTVIPTSSPDAATLLTPRGISALMASDTFMEAVGAPRSNRKQELEKRGSQRDTDATREAKTDLSQAERDWISRERAALEAARQQLANQELERAQRLAEEQARLEEQKRQLEQQQHLLEEKRREQQRLEQEIQLRAQLEFQKVQEEARLKESDLQHQRAAIEEALRERELEFQRREKQTLERLEAIKREAELLEDQVQQEFLTVRQNEVEHSRKAQDQLLVEELAREAIAEEERKLEELRQKIDQHDAEIPPPPQPPSPSGQSTSTPPTTNTATNPTKGRGVLYLLLAFSTLIIIGLGGGGLWFIGKQTGWQPFSLLQKFTDTEWQALQAERQNALEQQDWTALLRWAVQVADTPSASKHLSEIHSEANRAINALLSDPQPLLSPDPITNSILLNLLSKVSDWPIDSGYHLLQAKLRLPAASSQGNDDEVIQLLTSAKQASSNFMDHLQTGFDQWLISIQSRLEKNTLADPQAMIAKLNTLRPQLPASATESVDLLVLQINLSLAQKQDQWEPAMNTMLDAARQHPNWVEKLKPHARGLIHQLEQTKPAITPDSTLWNSIQTLAEEWKLPEANLLLAEVTQDPQQRIKHLQLAAQNGHPKALALLSHTKLIDAIATNQPDLATRAIDELREMTDKQQPEAMLLLAEVLLNGQGIDENPQEALELAQQALQAKLPEAAITAAEASIKLGELNDDPSWFDKAREFLRPAIVARLPKAHYQWYRTYYNQTARQPDRAFQALQDGAGVQDPQCLFTLGIMHAAGIPPARLDAIKARQYIEQAAQLQHPEALEWLQKNPQ